MKTLILLAYFGIGSFFLHAQFTDVAIGLNDPARLLLEGNTLYFTDANSLSKIDLSNPGSSPVTVVSDLNTPMGMVIDGNIMYVSQFGGIISKIDLSSPTPTAETFVSGQGIVSPNGLAIRDGFLYFSDTNSNYIGKIDLSAPTPVVEQILSNGTLIVVLDIEISGDYLYFTQNSRVFKIDLSDPSYPKTIFSNASDYNPVGIDIHGGNLYFGEYALNRLFSVPLATGGLGTVIGVGTTNVTDVAVSDDAIYICEKSLNKISKMDLSMGVNDSNLNQLSLYPNPSSEFIQIRGLDKELNGVLFNASGEKIKSILVQNEKNIDISELTNGLYILILENGKAFKFIKK